MRANENEISRQPWRPVWPNEFLHQRSYNPEEENKSYIEWAKSWPETALVDTESTGEESEDEEEEDDDDLEEGTSLDQSDHREAVEESNIKTFMSKTHDIYQFLPCEDDQIDGVMSFCECNSGDNDRQVALIDDRNNGGDIHARQGLRRPYLGPLRAEELLHELRKPRFNVLENVFDDGITLDAYRRIIFVSGLNSRATEVLAITASRMQAPALRDMFCKHLAAQASMGVHIPPQGYQSFALHFNIPYFALRSHQELVKDNRIDASGVPLRNSWKFHSLSNVNNPGSSTDQVDCVHEAHISFTVTGLDDNMWTAYAFVDSYFDELDSVAAYHEMKGPRGGTMDPLTMANVDAQRPIWKPRQYFVTVVGIRLRRIVVEWNRILKRIEKDIEQSRFRDDYKTNPHDDLKTQQDKRQRIHIWASQKMHELRIFKPAISNSIEALNEFKNFDIDYFRDEEAPSSLRGSLDIINKCISTLESAKQKVIDMMKELRQDYPQGLHAQLSFESNEAQIFQQRSASHIQMLTYVTILFIPVFVSTSIFSMQGVLPFTPTLAHFAYVLLILTIIVVVTLAALFNWSCLEPIIQVIFTIIREFFHIIIVLIPDTLRHGRIMTEKMMRKAQVVRRAIFTHQRRYRDPEQGLEMNMDGS